MVRFLLFALLAAPGAFAQPSAPSAPAQAGRSASGMRLVAPEVAFMPVEERLAGFAQRQRLMEASVVSGLPIENIGPTVMSGRVTDLDVWPADPTHFFVSYASGGLWHTASNGGAFTPKFDDLPVMTIGDIAVRWPESVDSDASPVVWVGTGENNSSRSSYAGTGVYKSMDGGENWTHLGLGETHHIGRIVLHPDDAETAWVAAIGHLYSPNDERGVFKTTDGGQSWTKSLFVNDSTGVIDLVIDPTDADVLYATSWDRSRVAWNFVEGGPGSAIYKSADGGDSWEQISTEDSGFPTGAGVGRIGLALFPGDAGFGAGQTIYAFLDNQDRRPEEEEDMGDDDPAAQPTRDALRTMGRDAFLALSEKAVNAFLDNNGFPLNYSAASVQAMVEDNTLDPADLVAYLEDANRELFDTPVIGGEVYRSDDGGQSWRKAHDGFIDDFVFSYGYYFGEIRVSPHDEDRLYLLGVPLIGSTDGGQTWTSNDADHVHVDHHALWVNPDRPGHLINGNDGGLNISYDDAQSWFKLNIPPVGQFYTVAVDSADTYRVYGGLQDNGVWRGPHTYEESPGWRAEGQYPYERIMGGDGMQIQVDPRTNERIYTGFQFGNYYRIERRDDGSFSRTRITPRHDLGERPLRFNWQTPIHLSRFNNDILYFGSNKLHRSMDRGETWTALSDDLTKGGLPGDVPYGTLTSLDESPLQFGLLWAGADDGSLHVTRDGGTSWTNAGANLPAATRDFWVSRVEASHHEAGRAYVSLNGYRFDNFTPLVFVTEDYGQSWTQLGAMGTEGGLPNEPVNVVMEDRENADLLYVGTDHGLYVSLDRGQSFMALMATGTDAAMPNAPVHDLAYHHAAHDLVVGTHGRSIYRASVAHLQQLTADVRSKPVHLFAADDIRHSGAWGRRGWRWNDVTTPDLDLVAWLQAEGIATLEVTREDSTGTVETVRTVDLDSVLGLNVFTYDLTADFALAEDHEAADDERFYLTPGTYTLTLRQNGASASQTLTVTPGPTPPSRDRKKFP
ncbi:MAG: glycosyl hydrolase [Bacteroidota bacterium]